MKPPAAVLALLTALTLPVIALARPVTLTTTLNDYRGDGACAGNLWMAGKQVETIRLPVRLVSRARRRYPAGGRHHRGQRRRAPHAGTHAGPCRRAVRRGYTLHVDAAVEDMRESPNEVALPLTAAGASASGSGYIASVSCR